MKFQDWSRCAISWNSNIATIDNKIGTTDISPIGSTITGAISNLSTSITTNLSAIVKAKRFGTSITVNSDSTVTWTPDDYDITGYSIIGTVGIGSQNTYLAVSRSQVSQGVPEAAFHNTANSTVTSNVSISLLYIKTQFLN